MTLEQSPDPVERQSWYLMILLSLVVSAAGVLNTMLMSVTQRYREIGTIKCLGALDSFVLFSVLLESAMVGFVGALAGVIAGLLVSVAIGSLEHGLAVLGHLNFDYFPVKLLATFTVGMSLTVIGAAIPAYIAAQMPPMEAMRGEK